MAPGRDGRTRRRTRDERDEDDPSRQILAGYMRQQGRRVSRGRTPDSRDEVTEIDLNAVRAAAERSRRGTRRR
jgi:hypothetical protein